MGFDILSMAGTKPTYDLTKLEFLVLLSLQRKPLHGYGIMRKLVRRNPAWKIKSGTLYPLLKRMVAKDLIKREVKRGKAKYSLTPRGKDVIGQYIKAWKEIHSLFKEMSKKEEPSKT